MIAPEDIDLLIIPTYYQVSPGRTLNIPVVLVNNGNDFDQFHLSVDGIPDEWVSISPAVVQSPPSERQTIQIEIHPPHTAKVKAGRYRVLIRLSSISSGVVVKEVLVNLVLGTFLTGGSLGVLVGSNQFSLTPGDQTDVPVYLINRSQSYDQYELTLEGVPSEWVSIEPGEIRLPPGGKGSVNLRLHPSRRPDCKAGKHAFTLVVQSKSNARDIVRLPCVLNVAAYTEFMSALEPLVIAVGEPAAVIITNLGNIPQNYQFDWVAAHGDLRIIPGESQALRLRPGEEGRVAFTSEASRRPWWGRGITSNYRVKITTGEREARWLEGKAFIGARLAWESPAWVERISQSFRHTWGRVNWPLVLGGLIVGLILVLAIIGPGLAPQNPMQENFALSVRGQILRPPYPPFTIPGYLLGTDEFGRDLLSRILWGIRPTLYLVLVIAFIRLIIGNVFGLIIGWSNSVLGRILEAFMSVSLAIPVLLVALMGITAVGIQKGFSAFIFGLAITGWAETARIISTQTRVIRQQSYIEAARALGSTDLRLLVNHVWKQLSPMLGMLMAFEISSTLFVVAELGFLGYFIGGGMWIEISDFVAINVIGLPELGQLLSTALVTLVKPLPLLMIGSVIFLTILGFNLLGEGLRLRQSRTVAVKPKWWWRINERIGEKFEKSYGLSLIDWVERRAVPVGMAIAIVVAIGGWMIWSINRPVKVIDENQKEITVPGGHYWANELHDAQGTQWAPFTGPDNSLVAWKFVGEGGFSASPVVDKDGNIYINDLAQQLVSLDRDGNARWRIDLPFVPAGSPAIGVSGNIYVTGSNGGLVAYSPDATPIWSFTPNSKREATSGPIVDAAENIYYTTIDHIQAVSSSGEELWLQYVSDSYIEEPPVLSAGGGYIFLNAVALAAKNGLPLDLEGLPVADLIYTLPEFFVGADQNTYFRTSHQVLGWRLTDNGVEVDPAIGRSEVGNVSAPPKEQGVTPEGFTWLFYTGDFFDTQFEWMDKEGKMLSNVRLPNQQSDLIAVDRDLTMYICSSNFTIKVSCGAWKFGEASPVWLLELGDYFNIVGGALAPNRMYVVTDDGQLLAVGAGTP